MSSMDRTTISPHLMEAKLSIYIYLGNKKLKTSGISPSVIDKTEKEFISI